jgi:hypothetical protein
VEELVAVGFSRRLWVTIGERRDGENVLNEVKGEREVRTRREVEEGGREIGQRSEGMGWK